jgi:hypothetical protein
MRNHRSTAGALIAALALLLMLGGGVALWGNAQKDDDGYFSTGSDRLATTTRALATEGLDVGLDGPGWLMDTDSFGKVRLTVDPHANKPIFVGIAHTRDVSRYLRQSAHATVTDVSYSPFRAAYRTHGGERRPGSPADQRFWATSAQGSGPQQLTWDVEHGSWSIVVMNADASPGVDAGVSAGANVPILSTLAWSLMGGGLLLLAASGALVFAGARVSGARFRDRSR